MNWKGTVVLGALLWMPASAADYTFTKIADSSPGSGLGFYSTSSNLAINSSGTVAFRAFRADSRGTPLGDLIFTGSGGALNTVADTVSTFRNLFPISMNSHGVVVFSAINSDFTVGLYTGAGGPPSKVATSPDDLITAATSADINDDGAVAYGAVTRIRLVSGGSARVVDPDGSQTAFSLGQFNRGGSLVFLSELAGVRSVRIDKGGVLTTLASQSSELNLALARQPAINDDGIVVVTGVTGSGVVRPAIFKIDGTRTTVVASGTEGFTGANINNAGTVAFGRITGGGGNITGIYIGPDPAADKVIAIGDPLFGSRVNAIIGTGGTPGRFLNDRGQIAFYYALADGTRGVAVASPAVASGAAPVLPADSIVNAASQVTTPPPSAGSIVSIFGDRFSQDLLVASTPILPTALGGVSVTFNGIAAPLHFVSPKQINAQVPFEIAGSSATVQVRTPAGQSETRTLSVGVASPGIYSFTQRGSGQAIVTFAGTATLVAPRGLTPDSRPARAGDILTIYANGLGAVLPPIRSGETSCGGACAPDGSNLILRRTPLAPIVEIGGARIPDENILFAGLAPEFVGLYQINLRLPVGITPGSAVSVVLRQGTPASRPDATVAIE